ncbi:hypothetical protein Avbf_05214 [Armadillidium vulgare]|nr:hypothetical protein Avbf_05214 [Armadillidium vulgare]
MRVKLPMPMLQFLRQECWRWDNSADFLYDVSEQYLNLTLTSSNVLGSRRCNYVINQYERMLPDPVSELKTKLEGPSKIKVSFQLPKFLSFFPGGIIHRVKISGECPTNFQIMGKTYGKKFITENIQKPLYQGQKYTFTVQIRSGNLSDEVDSEDWWSKPVTSLLTTPSSPPEIAPLTTHGGFHISDVESSNKTVYIFWKDIDNCSKNGRRFGYRVEVFSDGRR